MSLRSPHLPIHDPSAPRYSLNKVRTPHPGIQAAPLSDSDLLSSLTHSSQQPGSIPSHSEDGLHLSSLFLPHVALFSWHGLTVPLLVKIVLSFNDQTKSCSHPQIQSDCPSQKWFSFLFTITTVGVYHSCASCYVLLSLGWCVGWVPVYFIFKILDHLPSRLLFLCIQKVSNLSYFLKAFLI